MADENIFSGLKVVELASFIAGPSAATMLSDFGADVIKVEPPERRAVENRTENPATAAFGRTLSLPTCESKQAWRCAQSESCERAAGSRAA